VIPVKYPTSKDGTAKLADSVRVVESTSYVEAAKATRSFPSTAVDFLVVPTIQARVVRLTPAVEADQRTYRGYKSLAPDS